MLHKSQVPTVIFVMMYNFCLFPACKALPQVFEKIRGKKKHTVDSYLYVYLAQVEETPVNLLPNCALICAVLERVSLNQPFNWF